MDYEIFISYAHADDTPRQPGDDKGWITALRDAIVEDHKKYSTEPLRIFFDTEAIESMDHWERKIREGLRHSSILLVCLSPKYFQSEYCRKEWEEYQARQVHRLAGMDSIAPVYFAAAPDADAQDIKRWKEAVQRSQYVDLQEWYPKGLRALREEAVRKKLDGLGASLWQRIQRARRAAKAPGNMRSCNVHFVGRRREVCNLHESLATGAIGVVTAVHGLGGVGKTELAVAYAHGYADSYPGGLWSLNAEGKKELLPLFAELAKTPEMPMELDPNLTEEQVGQRVLAWLKKRAEAARDADRDKGAACLVLLDNVSEPELLSQSQLIHLPRERFDWLRVVATTRLGRDDFHAPSGKALGFVPVDALEEEDALMLLREHQEGEKWPYPEDEAAAREIVRELGGFALAIEQAAIHLGLKRDLRPAAYLARLRREGLQSVDALGRCPEVAREMLHREKQFAVIMAETWEELSGVERAALEYAALLPPESVIWPILRHVVGRDFPDALAYDAQQDDVDPWAACRRRLEGRRLITPGEYQEVGRLHRLAGECVRERLGDKAPDMRQALHEAVSEKALWLAEASDHDPGLLWWLRPLQDAVRLWWEDHRDVDLALASLWLGDMEADHGRLDLALPFLQQAHEFLRRVSQADPDSAEAGRDLLYSLHAASGFHLDRNKGEDLAFVLGYSNERL